MSKFFEKHAKYTIYVTPHEVAQNAHKYPGDFGYRGYIGRRFFEEHGVVVMDYGALSYSKARRNDGTLGIKVVATLGKNATIDDVLARDRGWK